MSALHLYLLSREVAMVILQRVSAHLLLCLGVVATTGLDAQIPTSLDVYAGNVTFSSSSSRPSVTLFGDAVSVNAFFDDGMVEASECRPCTAGSPLRLGARIVAAGKGSWMYEGSFTFESAEAVSVPDSGAAEIVLTAPFTFRGQVTLANGRNQAVAPIGSSFNLQGGGIVSLRLTSTVEPDSGGRLYFFKDITYEFRPAQ